MVFEGFLHAAERQDGWEETKEQDGVIISRRKFADIYSMRGIGIVDADPERIFRLVNDLNKRKQWDDLFCEGNEVERLDDAMIVYYMAWYATRCEEKSPSRLTYNRDFVVLKVARENEDGSFICVSKSVSHPKVPARQGFVRAEMESSGFIILPMKRILTNCTYLAQIDPKGKVPKSVESYVCQHRPMCILQLRKLVGEQNKLDDISSKEWHNASPFSATKAGKRLNRASVYVPNTRIFNTPGPSSWNMEEMNGFTNKEGEPNQLFHSPTLTSVPTPRPITPLSLSSSPVVRPTTPPFLNATESIASNKQDNTLDLDGSLSTQDIKSKLNKLLISPPVPAGSPGKDRNSTPESGSSSPITSRIKANGELYKPPDSPTFLITGKRPDSPTTRKDKYTTPPESPVTRRDKYNTPPDSPSTPKSSRLNFFESRTKSSSKIQLGTSPSPFPAEPDTDDNSKAAPEEEQPKKKGSKLNLFVAKISNSPSSSDDERQSLWQRATKHFQPTPRQTEAE